MQAHSQETRGNIKNFTESGECVRFSQQINLESHAFVLLQAHCRKMSTLAPVESNRVALSEARAIHIPLFFQIWSKTELFQKAISSEGLGGRGRSSHTCRSHLGGLSEEWLLQKAGQDKKEETENPDWLGQSCRQDSVTESQAQ